jgi:predicted nucleic acid-binding protein
MADAIIFPTAARHGAEIVTPDASYERLPGVALCRGDKFRASGWLRPSFSIR